MAIKIIGSTIIDDSRNIVNAGIATVTSVSIGNTQVISSARQLQNIASLDATTTATIEAAIQNSPNTFTDLNVTGVSTLGVTSATNLTAQQLSVSGVSTFAGITTVTGPTLFTKQLSVSGVSTLGTVQISSGIVTATSGVVTYYGDGSKLTNIQASSIVGVTTYATTAGIATNLKGGLAGNIPYQSAPDTTVFLANGSSGQVLRSNGVGNAPSWTNAASAGAITGITIRDEGTIVGSAGSVTELNFVGAIVSAASTAGIATITFADYVSNAGVATYATTAGVSTSVIGGIGSITQLQVSGISTFQSDVYIGSQRLFENITNFFVRSPGNIFLQNTDGSQYAAFISNGEVRLYYSNSKVFETIGSGVTITGTTFTNQLNVSGISTLGTVQISSGIVTATSGIVTYYGDGSKLTNIQASSITGTVSYATTAGIATYATSAGIATYATTAGVATALQNARTFQITGDVLASAISFDGTGNVSLAATIQPNSVGLGTDTFGDYVRDITGTSNQITVTGGTGEGSTPTLSIPLQFTAPQDVTVTRDLQVNRNLNVNGSITIGGTSAIIYATELKVSDPDIVLGIRTDGSGNDISNDTTANHGGIAVASTEGTPLISLYDVGIGETNPATYKKIMWFKSGTFAGLGTDAWLFNYGVGIGSTQFPNGTRLAAGSVQFTERDLAVVRNINASGIVTASSFSGNASSATYATTAGIATYATSAGIATYATNAGIATNATYATSAGIATYATNAGIATNATYATSAGIATYAITAGIATYATTAGLSTSVIGGIGSITQLQVTGVSTIVANSSADALRITQTGSGNAIVVEDEANPDATPFVVNAAGRVGIGITVPSAKLHIVGGVPADGGEQNLTVASSSVATIPATITAGNSPATLQVFAGGMGSGSQRGGQIDFVAGAASTNPGTLIFRTGTASGGTSQPEVARFDSSGNLGIGTTNPTSKLHVVGDTLVTGVSTIVANSSTEAFRITQTGTGNAFVVEDATNPDATPFVIMADGKVGVGTTGMIQYGSGASDTSTFGILASTGNDSAFVLKGNNGSTTDGSGQTLAVLVGSTGGSGSATNLVHYSHNTSGIGTRRNAIRFTDTQIRFEDNVSGSVDVTINSSGSGELLVGRTSSTGTSNQLLQVQGGAYILDSVGIGTTNPSQTLHVQGNARVTGAVYDSTNSSGTSGQVLQSTATGTQWVAAAPSGAISGITIRDEGTIVGSAGSVSTLNFVGAIVSAASTAGIATITFADYVSNAGTSTSVIGGIGSITQLQVTGISTFTNGPVLVGSATSTGTATQRLQVTGGAYVSGNLGIGTTNPQTKLEINGVLGFGANNNIRIGDSTTGASITDGTDNIFIGSGAGYVNNSGSANIFLGPNAGYSNQGGLGNIFFGSGAGAFNSNGSSNNSFGTNAGYLNTTGGSNNFIGVTAGYNNQTGSNNIFLGARNGISTSASYKVIIGSGYLANYFDSPDTNKSNQFAVGIRTDANPSKYWLVGDENFNIGIGTTNPTSKLTVQGDSLVSGVVTATTYDTTYVRIGSVVSTSSTTAQVGIHSALSSTTYRSVEYMVQAAQGTNFHTTKILAVHNGTTAYLTEYGTIYNNSTLANYDVDISGGNIRLLSTPASSGITTYVISFTATKV